MKFQGIAAAVLFAFAAPALGETVKVPLGAPPVIPVSNVVAPATEDEVRLNPSITVTGDAIRLGDIFTGFLARPEKVVAPAPRPGQRVVLSAEWLDKLARTYGLSWHPASAYDRVIAYQPGQTIVQADILAAVRTSLTAKGMPANFDLQVTQAVETITVALGASTEIGVREAFYDPAAKAFTAVAEIPANDPKAMFVPLRGVAYATVAVPVLKENAARNKTITADMIDVVSVRAELVKPTTITEPTLLIGKSPKFFVKAGLPVLESDVALIRLVEVPVMGVDASRDAKITANQIVMASFNAADLPSDAILDSTQLVGKTPRRLLPAGAPVRRGDVALVRQVEVPVMGVDASRDAKITANQIVMASFNAADLPSDAILDSTQLVGKTPRRLLPAGAPVRRGDVALVRQVHVPVAARDLNRGDVLTAADLNTITLTDAEVGANVITDVSDIVGRAAKHAMRTGQMMHPFDIARPVAVERGKMVTILYAVPLISLTAQGIAQEQGGVGDVVRVTNSKSNATVLAEVIDARTVRITTPKQAAGAN